MKSTKHMGIAVIIIIFGMCIFAASSFCFWMKSDNFDKNCVTVSLPYEECVKLGYVTQQSIKLVESEEPIVEIPLQDVIDEVIINLDKYSYLQYILGEDRKYTTEYLFNCEHLYELLEPLYVEGTDARIEYTPEGVNLVPEYRGREFEVESVVELIQLSKDYTNPIDISPLLRDDVITTDDLQSEYDELSWMNDWHVSYNHALDVDYSYIYPYIVNEGDIDWTEAANQIARSYTTYGNETEFTTSGGKVIPVTYKTYGYTVSEEDVISFLNDCWQNKLSKDDCVPVLSGYDETEGDYIEISVEDQHVWHYVDGALCCESDTVTGTKGKHDTPKGVYYISECINGKYLRGDDYVTWVNKWMRITNRGHGLHDATWRKSFGGDIYTYNGSHGCINLPKAYAYNLYDEVSVGEKVVIY